MAKLSDKEKQEIVRRSKPGFVVAESVDQKDERTSMPRPDASSPDADEIRRNVEANPQSGPHVRSTLARSKAAGLDYLRRIFFGDSQSTEGNADGPPKSADPGDVEIVPVRPAKPGNPYDAASQQSKGIVVKDGKIIGEQG